jgi:hypothetical protein
MLAVETKSTHEKYINTKHGIYANNMLKVFSNLIPEFHSVTTLFLNMLGLAAAIFHKIMHFREIEEAREEE